MRASVRSENLPEDVQTHLGHAISPLGHNSELGGEFLPRWVFRLGTVTVLGRRCVLDGARSPVVQSTLGKGQKHDDVI